VDLVKKDSDTLKEFERGVYEQLKYLAYAPILFISALTGQRVPRILDLIDQVGRTNEAENPDRSAQQTIWAWVETNPPPLFKNRIVN